MRLRLRIERNALPPVQTLWPVKDTSYTIAQLIQQVNDVFPLEADAWGYEDYAFTLAGYELLHYHVIKDALKDEDELVIKPLRWEDMRSRTMTGRDQISVDGRHLLDGVAWGRPALRAPTRPDVRIPPRKKRRLSQDVEAVNGDDELVVRGQGGLVAAAGDEHDVPLLLKEGADASEEDSDVLYNPEDADGSEGSDESDSDNEWENNPSFKRVDATMMARKEGQGSWHSNASSDSSSSEEDSSDDSSDSSDDSSSDSSSAPDKENDWDGITKNESSTSASKTKKALPNGVPPPEQQTPPKTNGTSNSKQRPSKDGQGNTSFVGLPNEGTSGTQKRNARRRDAKRLKHAKMSGAVGKDVTLTQYRDMLDNAADETLKAIHDADAAATATNTIQTIETGETASNQPPQPKKRKTTKKADIVPETPANIEDRRQQLVKAISSGGVDVNDNLDGARDRASAPPEEISSKSQAQTPEDFVAAPDMSPPSANTRRAKLDLAGSQRLLFGSLGVRVPKTQAEKEALQTKLSEKGKRKPVQKADAAETNDESSVTLSAGAKATETPESWQDKINLTAVECVDGDVTLSAPPFPFHQRWDPQFNRKGKKRASSTYMQGAGKKRKRGNGQAVDEHYDKYNADGYGDALNYGEEGEDGEYWEDGALLDDHDAEDDDFPALPDSLTTLPLLASPSEAKVNDIITYTELACDESTGWQPKITARTAKVLAPAAAKEESCRLRLSNRDVKPPSYDEEGKRVYGKFEMPHDDGDDEEVGKDARMKEVVWAELGEVRVVERAE